ncbi:hypothetical protein R6242_03455 [Iodobacter sp. CM08]|uniref:hypothetical protein n=1 Tax=Iodobacter sp. CM08 TaxID=3085902 RepID=UPI0029815846|nr:hypothetical protein [Iodobacter sp. CM08]MDW5415626.1 hypothetical protein [Iodobacter sp. CM08]
MKIQHSLALTISTLLLSACGGGDNQADATSSNTAINAGSSTPITQAQIEVSGRVLNVGYVNGAQVCFDSNDNNLCDSKEPQTLSDAQGRYSLQVPSDLRGTHLLAVLSAKSSDTGYPSNTLFAQGWTLAMPLEYEAGSSKVNANLSLLSSTYHMRLMSNGRNRLSNKNNVLLRAGKTDDYSVAADFDYVAAPVLGLDTRLKSLSDYLATRAAADKKPASLIDTAAVLAAWYNSYNVTTTPVMDIAKVKSADITTSLDNYSYRYFHTQNKMSEELRNGIIDNAGFIRSKNQITQLTSGGIKLANGAFWQINEQWNQGVWSSVSYPDADSLTLDSKGNTALFAGKEALQARSINALDGNMLSYQMPVSGVRYQMEVSADVFNNYQIHDWYGPQLGEKAYTSLPLPSTKPTACGVIPATATTPSQWFNACRAFFMDEYIAAKGGIKAVQDPAAKSLFFDLTLKDALYKWPLAHPLINDCTAANRQSLNIAGQSTCNALAMNSQADLFKAEGVQIESWAKLDASGAPRKLKLQLKADGSATLVGIAATTVASYATADITEISEELSWKKSPANPNVILLQWPPLVAGQPNRALPGHFAAADFSLNPATAAAPNFRNLAILVQDGALITGQYYGAGFTVSERYLNKRALETGIPALQYVVDKLYSVAGYR